jgi:Tol biopolymer transport system component
MVYAIPSTPDALDLWVANADTSEPFHLTRGKGEESDPSRSPDGRWIAYRASSGVETAPEIVVVRPDGTDQQLLIEHAAGVVAWTPTA